MILNYGSAGVGMSYSLKRCSNNRADVQKDKELRSECWNGRTWTRRIQWLEDSMLPVKLKLEDGHMYKEVLCSRIDAEIIYDRFREGQSIDDCISILGNKVPASLQSIRASRQEKT